MTVLWWAVEFILETSGALLSFRRYRVLSALLAFRAFADIFTFIALRTLGGDAYGFAYWAVRAIQYLLLCALACQIMGRMLEERRDLAPYIVGLAGGFGLLVVLISGQSHTFADRFLDAEISASALLAILITLGWATKKMTVSGAWGWITVGFLVSIGGNALCAFLWKFFPGANRLYPVPAIAALVIWNWVGLEEWAVQRIAAFRIRSQERKAIRADTNWLRKMGIGA